MKQLLTLRHAQAGGYDYGGRDADRPLTEQGRSDSFRVAQWLREFHQIPDTVLCSPAVRTLTTAEIVCEHLGIDTRRITKSPGIYEASTGDLIRILGEAKGETILLVGHNPALATLGSFATGGHVRLSPGSVAWITFEEPVDGPVQPGSGHLHRLHHVVQ